MGEFPKKCTVCDKDFIANKPNVRFCSAECKYQANRNRHVYIRESTICKNCGGELKKTARNYCDDCLFQYYYKTKSQKAYDILVRRGYGGRLMLEHLAGRGHKIQRTDTPAPSDKESKDE